MTGCGPILAAYRRHRARSRRAWAIALIGPPEAVAATVAELEPDAARVHWVRDARSGRLASADRDALLERQALIVFAAPDPGAWSRLRATAPDLTTTLDGVFEVEAPAPAPPPWSAVREALLARVRDDTHALGLAGWLDGPSAALPVRDAAVRLVLPPARVQRRLVLLADAGEGKTTHLQWLAQARPADVVGDRVPVWLSLAAYGRDAERAVRPVATFLAESLARRGVVGARALAEHADEIVVLADGLDEIASPAVRRAVVQDLTHGPWGSVVLTGRRIVADDLGRGWAPLRRLAFAGERRDAVVRQAVAALGRRPADAERLLARIRGDTALDRAVGTPLLAVFAAVLDGEDRRLPTRRVELVERVAARLADRWGADRAQALRALAPIGWRLATTPGGALDEAELRAVLLEVERGADPAGADRRVEAQLAALQADRAALLPSPWGWRMPHPSVAQHFAALEAIRAPAAWKRLLANPFDPLLAEVVVAAAAVLDLIRADDARRDELLRAVLRQGKRPGRYGAVHPSVLGRLIVETEHVGAALYGELVRRWCDLVFKAAYGALSNDVVEEEAREVLDAMRHHPRAALFGEIVAARRGAVDWDRRTRDGLEPALTAW